MAGASRCCVVFRLVLRRRVALDTVVLVTAVTAWLGARLGRSVSGRHGALGQFLGLRGRGEHPVLPAVRVRPAVRQVRHGTRHAQVLEGGQRVAQDLLVELRLVRTTRGVAQRIVQIDGSGRPSRTGDVACARHRQRRDSFGLNGPRDQTPGLMANRSHRHEQHHVELIGHAALGQLRDQLLANAPGAVDAAHQGVGVRAQLADLAAVSQGTQGLDGEHAVDVGASIGQVVGEVCRPQVGRVHVGGDRPVRRVVAVMERRLAHGIDAAGGDESDAALRDRLGQRCPRRRRLAVHPAVLAVTQADVLGRDSRDVLNRWLAGSDGLSAHAPTVRGRHSSRQKTGARHLKSGSEATSPVASLTTPCGS